MKLKKIFLSTLLIIGIVLLAIGFFVGTGTETVTAKDILITKTDNIKEYDAATKTVTLKDKDDKEIATIKLLTPLDNKVGLGYQRIAEYEVTGKINIAEDFFGEVLTYDKVKYDNEVLESLNKVIDLKYKTTEDYLVNDYICSDSTSINDTIEEVCEITGSHTKQREVWLDFDEKTKPKKDEKIIIGLYTTTYQYEVGEWIQYFAGVPVEEWATWTADLNVDITSFYKWDNNDFTDSLGINNGTNQGTTNISGIINSARYYNSDYIDLGAGELFGNENSAKSISVWIYGDGLVNNAYQPILEVDSGIGFGILFTNTGTLRFGHRGTGNTVWQLPITSGDFNGVWTHIVGVKGVGAAGSSTYDIYINGVKDTSGELFGFGGTGAINYIGRDPYSNFFRGRIDELGIWSRELTQEEITQLYNNGDAISWTDIFLSDECTFSGYVFDESSTGLVGANVTIWNQFNISEFYENTTITGGAWSLNVTNSTKTYMVGAYFNNTLIGQLKQGISGTC